MKIWISQRAQKGGYAVHLLARMAGILVLAVVLAVLGGIAPLVFGWPRELSMLLMVLGVTALVVALALALGRRSEADTMIYCRDDEGRLFAVDSRSYVRQRAGGRDVVGAAVKTQRILANLTGGVLQKYMAQPQSLTGLTPQILAVENLKPAAGGYALVCTVRMPGGAEARQSYFVSAGMEDADQLLHELEKLRSLETRLEPRDTRHTGAPVVSAAAALLLGAVCAASHPAVGLLDSALYFPCLGLAFAAVCVAVWFAVKRSRGERAPPFHCHKRT